MKHKRAILLSQKVTEELTQYPAGTWVAIRYERVIASAPTRQELNELRSGATVMVQVQ